MRGILTKAIKLKPEIGMKINKKETWHYYKLFSNKQFPTVTRETYLKVLGEFSEFLAKKIADGFVFTIPYRLGKLYVRGKLYMPKADEKGRIKGLIPDWGKTYKLWKENPEAKKNKEVIYYDPRTNQYRYKIVWETAGNYIHTRKFYMFKPSRNLRRLVTEKIREGNPPYVIK